MATNIVLETTFCWFVILYDAWLGNWSTELVSHARAGSTNVGCNGWTKVFHGREKQLEVGILEGH